MADLIITSEGLGTKFSDGRNNTTFTINEFSVRKNVDGNDKVHVISDLKDNYAEYVIQFTSFDNITYNGSAISTIDDLFTTLESISANNVGIISDGGVVTVQNPLPSDGDSIYIKDIDWDNSDFADWTGNPEDLFTSPFNTGIENTTSDNPKSFTLAFNRTIYTSEMGFGCNDIAKSFGSDIVLKFLGSGGVVRKTVTSENGNPNSRLVPFGKEAFNSITIEFPTASTVTLTNITARKTQDVEAGIKGIDPAGTLRLVNTNFLGNLLVSLDEQKDAFGRLKTADPFTIFDNSLTTELSDTLFWSELLNGTATGTYEGDYSRYDLEVAASGDYNVRQTKQRFKYQPAKSHEFFITGLFNTETNVKKRAGLVDYDDKGLATITNVPQNGVFFENNNGTLSWNIANNGTITESVEQENWNLDTLDGNGRTGFVLDIDAVNILTCQLEWLGVGVVLVGFATGGGAVAYCHAFQHASQSGFIDVYMRTANLPVSYEITSTGGTGTLKQICSSVISGGGFNPVGDTDAIFNTSDVAVSNGDTELLVGMRLQEDSFEYTIEPTQLSILSTANGNTQWLLCLNPTYSGTTTFVDKDNTVIQESTNNNNIVSDFGKIIAAGSFANNQDSVNEKIDTALKIGKSLDGTRDELWLCVTALGNEDYRGTINFKQLI